MSILAPSMIAADWWNISADVQALENAGCAWLHFDAMDGNFVPNLTLGPMFLEAVRPYTKLHFDTHLMIDNAGNYVDDFLEAGANSISVHWENNPHLQKVLSQIREGGAMAGVVLNPATPVNVLEAILGEVDYVLLMSVNPGFSGQPFLPLVILKMQRLAQMRQERGLNFLIQVDGGISAKNAGKLVRAGADVLVCGSSIFNERPLAENVAQLNQSMASANAVEI
jgi:ribulose-phosphate 3-epimerase